MHQRLKSIHSFRPGDAWAVNQIIRTVHTTTVFLSKPCCCDVCKQATPAHQRRTLCGRTSIALLYWRNQMFILCTAFMWAKLCYCHCSYSTVVENEYGDLRLSSLGVAISVVENWKGTLLWCMKRLLFLESKWVKNNHEMKHPEYKKIAVNRKYPTKLEYSKPDNF